MIQIEHVSKSYQDKQVLADFSLTLPENRKIAFMGPSGCGKTTLLRLLAGLEQPDAGHITGLEGKKISVMFQEDRLIPSLNAEANVALVAPVEDWLKKVGLEGQEKQKAASLSGGMQRRIALARTLAYQGDVVFLDEPFKGMDEVLKARMIALLKEELFGKTLIFVTHQEQEAMALADEVLRFEGIPLKVKK